MFDSEGLMAATKFSFLFSLTKNRSDRIVGKIKKKPIGDYRTIFVFCVADQ